LRTYTEPYAKHDTRKPHCLVVTAYANQSGFRRGNGAQIGVSSGPRAECFSMINVREFGSALEASAGVVAAEKGIDLVVAVRADVSEVVLADFEQ
jgi:hypothetical protein